MKSVLAQNRIQSLDRGLRILEYITDKTEPVRLQELAELLGIEKVSIHRLVNTLADRDYVKQDPVTLGYVAGHKITALTSKQILHQKLLVAARKHFAKLAHQTHETSHIAIRGSGCVVFVDYELGDHLVGVNTKWGDTGPLHCTGVGKALLAGLDEKELREALGCSNLKKYTPNTITKFEDLKKECGVILEKGVAYDHGEYDPDVSCIACPIFGFNHNIVAAIGISAPKRRIDKEQIKKLTPIVRECAIELSKELGHGTTGC